MAIFDAMGGAQGRGSEWLIVVSRLVLRWAAKQPQHEPEKPRRPVSGPLRAPAQGKPAHYKTPVHPDKIVFLQPAKDVP
ncbi:hypothetical protein [Pseudomonas sp. SDO5271_S396]